MTGVPADGAGGAGSSSSAPAGADKTTEAVVTTPSTSPPPTITTPSPTNGQKMGTAGQPTQAELRTALLTRDEALTLRWLEEACSSPYLMGRWLLTTEVEDGTGNTFIHMLCSCNLQETLKRLLLTSLTINLHVRNAGQETPLHVGSSEAVVTILLTEARRRSCVREMVTALDTKGWSALDHAVHKRNWRAADAIRAAGGVCVANADPCPAYLDLSSDPPPSSPGGRKYRHPQCIQFASDIHLEFFRDWESIDIANIIQPVAPYLALLGDIGVVTRRGGGRQASQQGEEEEEDIYRRFLLTMAGMFEKVFILSGNHEYYASSQSVEETDDVISEICASHPNLVYCRRTSISIFEGRIRILATSTLWSFIPPYAVPSVEGGMMDFRRIKVGPDKAPLTYEQVNTWHHETVAWLSQELRRSSARGERVVVLSHHAPSFLKTSPTHYRGPLLNQLSFGFASNLEFLFRKFNHDHTKIENSVLDAWAFGHTHHCLKEVVHGTTLLANQYGYQGHEVCPGYRPDRVIDLKLDSWIKGAGGELLRRFSRTPSY